MRQSDNQATEQNRHKNPCWFLTKESIYAIFAIHGFERDTITRKLKHMFPCWGNANAGRVQNFSQEVSGKRSWVAAEEALQSCTTKGTRLLFFS